MKDFHCLDNGHYDIIPEKPYSDKIWTVKAKLNSIQEQASFTKFSSAVKMDISPTLSLFYAHLSQDMINMLKIAAASASHALRCCF